MNKYRMSLVGLMFLCITGSVYAQTCKDNIQPTTPDSRFEVLSDEVIDLKTGLIWQRCSVGQSWDGASCAGTAKTHNWSQALKLASGDWRLPNVKELNSIIETACADSAINLSVFPNTLRDVYWSSSPSGADVNGDAWAVDFYLGSGTTYGVGLSTYVRLVRGGQ